MSKPLVTVYVLSRNYGHFLGQALASLESQSFLNFEVIVIDDASGDNSREVANEFARRDERFVLHANKTQQGLQKNANFALGIARGKYIMRLDADDWLDPNALLVMSHFLETHEDTALVFPNYYYVDFEGGFLGIERRRQLGRDTTVLDLPAHGACTMVRRRILKSVGGYDEAHNAQDGYELWLKITSNYKVASIETPLFYYRQHPHSLSTNETRILNARTAIKKSQADRIQGGPVRPKIVAIIPAKNTYQNMPNIVFERVGDKPLLDHTLDAAFESEVFDSVYVTTDDSSVVEYVKNRGCLSDLRPQDLSQIDRRLSEVVFDAVNRLETEHQVFPDILCVLSLHSPLRKSMDIQHAVDTLKVFDVDSVISVYEDQDVHLRYGSAGLEPLNPGAWHQLRLEREALFAFNGAIITCWRDLITRENLHGTRVSHVTMPQERSFQIKKPSDLQLVEMIYTALKESK